jgi:hypothetical protein
VFLGQLSVIDLVQQLLQLFPAWLLAGGVLLQLIEPLAHDVQ